MKQCTLCQSVFPLDDVFCPNDGSTLISADNSPNTSSAFFYPPSAETKVISSAPTNGSGVGRFGSRSQFVLIGVLSLIVIVLAGILILSVLPDKTRNSENEKQRVDQVTRSFEAKNAPVNSWANTPQNPRAQPYTGSNAASPNLLQDVPRLSPRGNWTGDWSSTSGAYLTIAVDLSDDGTGKVSGQIEWTLRRTTRPDKMSKIGMSATEYVSGQFDPVSRTLTLKGYRTNDPYQVLVMLDSYRLSLSADTRHLNGSARNGGKWNARVNMSR